MKILIAASTFPRWQQDAVPDFVWQQTASLERAYPDLELHVLAPHAAGAEQHESWNRIDIHRFRYFWPSGLQQLVYPAIWPNIQHRPFLLLQIPFLLLTEFVATIRLARKYRIDLIYSHWFAPQGIACGLAAHLLKIPHVITSHSSDVQVMSKLPGLGRFLVRFIIRRSKAVSVVSKRSMHKLAAFFPPDEWRMLSSKISRIPMGVECSAWAPLQPATTPPASAPPSSGKQVLLFIGRLVEKKGLQYLLEALTLPRLRRRSDFELIVAGDGPLLSSLRDQATALSLHETVRFVGFVQGDEKRRCFAASHMLIIPSIVTASGDAEGLPVCLLEGLAAGKICIATDCSGADEVIVDAHNGFLVPERSPHAIEAAIVTALSLSRAARTRIAHAALATSRQFDWATIATRHYELLFR